MCQICQAPLEEGFIIAHGGVLGWVPAADLDDVGDDVADEAGLPASRCPDCRMGVFDYDHDQLGSVRASRTRVV